MKVIAGINEQEHEIIQDIIKNYSYRFFCYGSRVRGNFHKVSDLDMLAKDDNLIPQNILAEIDERFYNSRLPFIVNILDFNQLSPAFYELIKKDLVEIK
jgi:predicted nucleotidyltransferase